MAGRSQLKEVPSLEDVEQLGRVEFHIRGRLYVVEEVEASDYEADAKLATNEQEGTTDMALLTKLLTLRAVTRDGAKLDAAEWGKEKFPVVNRVQNEVRRLHYVEMETDEEREEREKAEKKADADAKKKQAGPDLPNS
jgi:hypothetical protein